MEKNLRSDESLVVILSASKKGEGDWQSIIGNLKKSHGLKKIMIKIELNNEDAELFKLFREYQDEFVILIKEEFFIFRGGSQTYHRDENGKIRKVDKKKSSLYKPKSNRNKIKSS